MKNEKSKTKTSEVKLRAFKIGNPDIKKAHSDVKDLFFEKLERTIIKDRGMLINEGDPLEETDYVAYYDASKKNIIFGAIIKTMASEDAPNITESMMNEKNIVISELNHVGEKSNIVKYLYYFAMDNNYLITNLRAQQCIASFQTYVNWFLSKERGNKLYYFQPLIIKQEINNIRNVKGIRFQEQKTKKDDNKEKKATPIVKKIKDIQKEILALLIPKDTPNYNEIIEDDFISAEILLKFAPKKKDKEEYDKILGLLLNSISDPDSVSLDTKKGKNIKLGDVELKKTVEIQKTESGLLSEQELYQSMESFLNELNKE